MNRINISCNIGSLNDLCNQHVHTYHNNKVDKTNILQRNGLMLNRNIKNKTKNKTTRTDKWSISANYLFTIWISNAPLPVKFTPSWLCWHLLVTLAFNRSLHCVVISHQWWGARTPARPESIQTLNHVRNQKTQNENIQFPFTLSCFPFPLSAISRKWIEHRTEQHDKLTVSHARLY